MLQSREEACGSSVLLNMQTECRALCSVGTYSAAFLYLSTALECCSYKIGTLRKVSLQFSWTLWNVCKHNAAAHEKSRLQDFLIRSQKKCA